MCITQKEGKQMKNKAFENEIDFDKIIVERFNPKHERLTQEIYENCQKKLLADRGYDCSDFHRYMHFEICEGLKKYYIENDINPESFEENLAESYVHVVRHEPDQKFKNAQDKYEFVLRDVIRKLKNLHKDTLVTNAQLNYDYDPNVDKFESSEQKDALELERRNALLKEIKSLKYGGLKRERNQKILLDYFGLYGNPKTLKEIGKEAGISPERVRQIIHWQMREIHLPHHMKRIKECCENDQFSK